MEQAKEDLEVRRKIGRNSCEETCWRSDSLAEGRMRRRIRGRNHVMRMLEV